MFLHNYMLDQQPPIGVSPLVHMQSFRPFPVHLKLGRRYTVCVCVCLCSDSNSLTTVLFRGSASFGLAYMSIQYIWQNQWTRYLITHVLDKSPSHWNWTKWIRHIDISIVPCPVPHGHAPLSSNSRWEETIPAYPTSTISSFYSHVGILEWKHAMYTCKAYANLCLQQLNKKATVDSINQ